jgi:hypothetical protein
MAQRTDRAPSLGLSASGDLPVTDNTITVPVEWALQGKTLGRAGARVLACSSGKLSRENFTELIGRFSLGTPDELPQVSVSYLTSGTGPTRRYYFGMAIHKWAPDVQTNGGELLERDDDNRPVAVTTYFCVPYRDLADAGVSYQAMYREFSKVRPSTTSGPPLRVKIPVDTDFPAISALAMQSASRLLTGRPVCVLGAESTTVAERLEFIGAVAALLPYGFRTRLTATTWVRPTHRDHRFRLFFSAAKRDADSPDDVVYWGCSEQTALTPHDDYAHAYFRWLADPVGQMKVLAGLTTPRAFNRDEILESLDEIGFLRSEQNKRGANEPGPPAVVPPPPKDAYHGGEKILRDCARHMQAAHLPGIHVAITHLKARAKSDISPEERRRYQEIIKEQHLFRHQVALGKLEAKLREELLKVAFDPPFRYADYCLIEDSVGAESPDHVLLKMIAGKGMSDMRIRAVVYGQLPAKDVKRRLDDWYKSGEVSAVQLISMLVGDWDRPRHAFHASVTAANLMSRITYEPPDPIRELLQQHCYLARLLQTVGDGDDQNQVYVLTRLLGAAYPEGLREEDVRQILIENPELPSRALMAAVLIWLARPDDAELARLAREAYVFRTTLAMDLDPDMREILRLRLPFPNGRPGGSAAGGYSPRHGPGLAGSGS